LVAVVNRLRDLSREHDLVAVRNDLNVEALRRPVRVIIRVSASVVFSFRLLNPCGSEGAGLRPELPAVLGFPLGAPGELR
jgi:hypothetical protein